jgi:hypothetical protein
LLAAVGDGLQGAFVEGLEEGFERLVDPKGGGFVEVAAVRVRGVCAVMLAADREGLESVIYYL